MIDFACRCKHRFSLGEDMAGGVVQCPVCGLLNDVPTLDDLPHLQEDGTYDIEVERPTDDSLRLAQLSIFYAKGRRDADGDEIDLRMTPEDVLAAGDHPAPTDRDRPSRVAPRYDPETGELIRAVEVAPDAAAQAVAIPLAMPAIGYATPGLEKRISFQHIFLELFKAPNLIVMMFIFLAHILLQISALVVAVGMIFLVIAPLILLFAIVAHYGNVIDEIGPQAQDELPRPLRSCSWHEDIWSPFTQVAGAFIVAALPAIVVLSLPIEGPIRILLAGLADAAALFFFPAILLTLTTSGTILNLRPDRIIGVIRVCGMKYVLALVLGMIAFTVYGVGVLGASIAFISMMGGIRGAGLLTTGLFSYPILLVGIYLMHAYCWWIALLYRTHHDAFPWVLQRHISERKQGAPPSDAPGASPPRPRGTQEKLRELREAERRRRTDRSMVDQKRDQRQVGE